MEYPYILAAVFMVAVTLVAVTSMTNTTRRWKVRVADLEKQLDAMSKTIDNLRKLNGEQLERLYGQENENKLLKEELTGAKQLAETRRVHVVQRNAEVMQAASDNAVLQETINELRQKAKKQHFPLVNAKVTDDEKSYTLCLVVETEHTGDTIPLRTLVKSTKNKAELVAISDKINKLTVNG